MQKGRFVERAVCKGGEFKNKAVCKIGEFKNKAVCKRGQFVAIAKGQFPKPYNKCQSSKHLQSRIAIAKAVKQIANPYRNFQSRKAIARSK